MTVEQFLRSSSSVYYYYYFSFMKNDATQQFVVCSRFFFSQSDSSNFIEKRGPRGSIDDVLNTLSLSSLLLSAYLALLIEYHFLVLPKMG